MLGKVLWTGVYAGSEPHAEPPAVAQARPSPNGSRRSPLPLVAAALGAGMMLARFLDWRGHAHPRD